MTYEGIEFAIRAGLGRNDWVATTREEAIALTQDRIPNWWKRQKLKARATS